VDDTQSGPTFTVNTTIDTADSSCAVDHCSLREAIIAANINGDNNTIIVPAGTYALTLPGANERASQTGSLDITSNIVIDGAGAGQTTIQGVSGDPVLFISGTSVVTLQQVGITGGSNGVQIQNTPHVTLLESHVYNNGLRGVYAASTGSYPNYSHTLLVNRSTISGNMGGGIYLYYSYATIENSTISGNTFPAGNGQGGGIFQFYGGTVNVRNATITNNHASSGGGILGASSFFVANSIIYGNTASTWGANCYGQLLSQGHNMIALAQPSYCHWNAAVGADGDFTTQDPLLQPLADNGGSTPTHALGLLSSILGTGNSAEPGSGGFACLASDQRGIGRDRYNCDPGAFQTDYPPSVVALQNNAAVGTPTINEGSEFDTSVT